MEAGHSRSMIKWLRYSGFSVIIVGNPVHWSVLPWWRREANDGWPSPNERTYSVGWMFLILRMWIDDGSW
jgi:hypothetical protein